MIWSKCHIASQCVGYCICFVGISKKIIVHPKGPNTTMSKKWKNSSHFDGKEKKLLKETTGSSCVQRGPYGRTSTPHVFWHPDIVLWYLLSLASLHKKRFLILSKAQLFYNTTHNNRYLSQHYEIYRLISTWFICQMIYLSKVIKKRK